MKPPKIPVLAIGLLALALLLGLTVLSCSGTRSSAKELDVAEGAPFIAENVTFVDIDALRGDEDLVFLLTAIEDALDPGLTSVGAEMANIDRAVTYLIGEQRVVVLDGDIGKEKDVRRTLSNSGYQSETVRGVDILSGEGPVGAVAPLASDRIIMSVDARGISLSVTDLDDERYFGKRVEMGLLLADLPDGTVMSLTANCPITEACMSLGISFSRKDAALSSFTMVAVFPSESEALSGEEQVGSLFALISSAYPVFETQVIGRRVIITGDAVSQSVFEGIAREFVIRP